MSLLGSMLLLIVKRRSGGIGIPETMYLKMRAWCSSSCHCEAVNGYLVLFLAPAGLLRLIIFSKESLKFLKQLKKLGKREA